MRRRKNIEKIIKKFDIDVNPGRDRDIFDELQKAQSESRQTDALRPNVWRALVKRKVARTAVAAAIIIVLSLFWFAVNESEELQRRQSDRFVATAASKTPSELVSVISLNIVFRDGDMKAVERQFEQAEKKVMPTLRESIVIDQLISEL